MNCFKKKLPQIGSRLKFHRSTLNEVNIKVFRVNESKLNLGKCERSDI
jgi:hypothetical protein